MHLRYRLLALATCISLMLGVAMAEAKQTPQVAPANPLGGAVSVHKVKIGTPLSATTVCTLGETGTPMWLVDYICPPSDQYYTLLNPAQCTACPGTGRVLLTVAHVLLEFRNACSTDVTISIVGVDPANPGCPQPNPTRTICDPISVTLASPFAGVFDFAVALPTDCCISGPAFLCVSFDAFGAACPVTDGNFRPRLVTTDGCNPCESYNVYSNTLCGAGFTDLCSVTGFPGNPIMNVEADCCQIVPNKEHTWGELKIRYRG